MNNLSGSGPELMSSRFFSFGQSASTNWANNKTGRTGGVAAAAAAHNCRSYDSLTFWGHSDLRFCLVYHKKWRSLSVNGSQVRSPHFILECMQKFEAFSAPFTFELIIIIITTTTFIIFSTGFHLCLYVSSRHMCRAALALI